MPFVQVFTRANLSKEVRAKLAEDLSNTLQTVEIGHPTESAKLADWMWFQTVPADSWAVGGRFDDTYVKGRKMALFDFLDILGGEVSQERRDEMGAKYPQKG